MLIQALLLVLGLASAVPASPEAKDKSTALHVTQELGVLEDWGELVISTDRRENAYSYRNQVRVLFRYADREWTRSVADAADVPALIAANAALPDNKHWTVALNGRMLGRLSSRPCPEAYRAYRDIGIQAVDEGARVPQIGPRKDEFGSDVMGPHRRPLALVARPAYRDISHWVRQKTLAISSGIVDCMNSGELCEPYTDPPRTVASVANLELVCGWESKNKERILTVQFQKGAIDPVKEEESVWIFPTLTFLERPGKPVCFLGPGMELIDSGDYDSDGESELLFWYEEGDPDGNNFGYTLVWGHLEKTTTFSMHNH